MPLPDSYLSVSQAAEGLYKDKGSKFIGYVFPVKDLEDIKEQINSLKELHPKARHICYAYRLGFSPVKPAQTMMANLLEVRENRY